MDSDESRSYRLVNTNISGEPIQLSLHNGTESMGKSLYIILNRTLRDLDRSELTRELRLSPLERGDEDI